MHRSTNYTKANVTIKAIYQICGLYSLIHVVCTDSLKLQICSHIQYLYKHTRTASELEESLTYL